MSTGISVGGNQRQQKPVLARTNIGESDSGESNSGGSDGEESNIFILRLKRGSRGSAWKRITPVANISVISADDRS